VSDAPEVKDILEDAWTTQELADHYQIPLQTVQAAAKRGAIPGCALVLGRYLFDPKKCIEWVPSEVKLRRGEVVKTNRDDGGGTGFVEGNAAAVGNRSPGRPTRRKEEKFLLLLSSAVSESDWKDVIYKALEQAKEGDWRARQWLSDYLIGKPVQRVLADVEVTTHRDFEVGQRAAAIQAMFAAIGKGRVIDGTAVNVGETTGKAGKAGKVGEPEKSGEAEPGPGP